MAMANVQHPHLPALEPLLQRGGASRGSSTESARATLLQRGDASRGSSTESARETLLQRGDAPMGGVSHPLGSAAWKTGSCIRIFWNFRFSSGRGASNLKSSGEGSRNQFQDDPWNHQSAEQPWLDFLLWSLLEHVGCRRSAHERVLAKMCCKMLVARVRSKIRLFRRLAAEKESSAECFERIFD